MNKIPLWGKIVGGCGLALVLALIIGGCSIILFTAGAKNNEPTASPETTTTQEEETPTETEEPEEPVTTEPEVTEPDTTGGINTCLPDQDQAMAEVVASFTYSDVTIYADQVYVVAEDASLDSFYVVAGSDVGTIIVYTTGASGTEPMAYAANDVTVENTALVYPEELGEDPIDLDSETYKVAEGCVS